MSAAFAARDEAGIRINTISDTERAAKVNWLGTVGGIVVMALHSDEAISHCFADFQKKRPELAIVRVEVRAEDEGLSAASGMMVIAAMLKRQGGQAFVHQNELEELDPHGRVVVSRDDFLDGFYLTLRPAE